MPSPSCSFPAPARVPGPRRAAGFHRPLLAALGLIVAAVAGAQEPTPDASNELGLAAHRVRNLGEASRHYNRVLALDPPAEPTAAQRELALRLVPRLHTVRGEFFPLKDIVAILHPDRPVIGYHLFWEDDIGYPADNEPCDHEIVWVEYDPATAAVVRVSTYFHGRLLAPAGAAAEANAHGGRPWIGVEWGFHGSLPHGALEDDASGARAKLREHWQLAHTTAGRPPRSPLARGWPDRFAGDFAAYLDFSTPADPAALLRERGPVLVSRWPTAALNRWCLRYNFAAKTEWPWLF